MDVYCPVAPLCTYMSGLMTCRSKFSLSIQRIETVSRWIMGLWLWALLSFFWPTRTCLSWSGSNHWVRFSNRDLGLAYFCWSEWGTFMVLWVSACVPLVQNNGYNNAFFGWLFSLGYVSHSADIEERQQELLFGPEGIVINPKSTEIIRSPFYLVSYPECLRSIF